MKTIKHCAIALALLFVSFLTHAQEVDVRSGDLAILKGETTINIEFTFNKMSVGDFSKEADYIKKKIAENDAKDPPNGDYWASKWEEDKTTKYGPKFILGFTNLSGIAVDKSAKYSMIVNTSALEPGYSVGVSKRNAGIDGTITIVETANRTKKLASLYFERPGENMFRGAAFDAGSRIADAYYLTGQKTGKFFKKNIK